MLAWGWPTIYDAGTTLSQHWVNVNVIYVTIASKFHRKFFCPIFVEPAVRVRWRQSALALVNPWGTKLDYSIFHSVLTAGLITIIKDEIDGENIKIYKGFGLKLNKYE